MRGKAATLVSLHEGVRSGEIADVLVRIVERRLQRYSEPQSGLHDGEKRSPPGQGGRFESALEAVRSRGRTAIIAEVKMGSPKLGDLRDRVDAARQARLYRDHAAALSVVVEPDFFYGSYELLERCVGESGLPAIAKDFVVDVRQLDAAAAAGAAAVLLIAALYEQRELHRLARLARDRGLTPLVETHTASDVAKLGAAPWELVGVNNRDLRTFDVDLQNSIDLLPALPAGALRVAESGLAARSDIERLQEAGFDAFLIGESLLLSDDPAAKLQELLGAGG